MATTTWKQVVYDVANAVRTLLGTTGTIQVGQLAGKISGITRKSAATYTPSTSAQTIAAGQYLAGAQTIAAVPTETKSATPSTSAQTITPSSGKFLSSVSVSAMPSGALSDITVSSAGLITGQVGTSGYLASGTKKTKQLTTKAATTITPTSSAQTAVASGTYTTGAITVAAVPTETKTVTAGTSATTATPTSGKYLTSVTVNPTPSQSKTATPSTSSQTITPDSGKLLSSVTVDAMPTGTMMDIAVNQTGLITSMIGVGGYLPSLTSKTRQLTTHSGGVITPGKDSQAVVPVGVYTTGVTTVMGDIQLRAENIREGVSIFGVAGSFAGLTPETFGYTKMVTGTYVPTSDATIETVITHSLGKAPNLVIVFAESTIAKAYGTAYFINFSCINVSTAYGSGGITWMASNSYRTGSNGVSTSTTTFNIGSSTGLYYKQGVSYRYILMA